MGYEGKKGASSAEKKLKSVPIEVLKFSDISEDTLKQIYQYSKKENQLANNFDGYTKAQRLEAQAIQAISIRSLLSKIDVDGNLLIIRNKSSDVIGVGILVFDMSKSDPHRVPSRFFGRAFDSTHLGIGSQLLNKELEIIKDRGIESFIASVNKESRKVYESVDVEIKVIEELIGVQKLLVTV